VNLEQWIALCGALTTVLLAAARVIFEVRRTHRLVNSRMDELLALTRKSSLAEGRLESPHELGANPPRQRGEPR
jgi:hypothetical protein